MVNFIATKCLIATIDIILLYISSLGYRPFMMLLQPQVSLLDKFVIQQESIPNLMTPIGFKQGQIIQRNGSGTHSTVGAGESIDTLNKNVRFSSNIFHAT